VEPLLARTNREAHLYMDIHPCVCGEVRFDRRSSVVHLGDDLGSRYAGQCPACGREREFIFRLPEQIMMPTGDDVVFGAAEPSQLIDAGEWLWISDRYAKAAPSGRAGLDGTRLRRARQELATAAAAIDEVLKFVPEGSDAVPSSACWTARGLSLYDQEPGRFRVIRLSAVRDTYRRMQFSFA
jgi:hypothetical protein